MGLVVSPVSEYVHAPGKFIAPIPPHSLRVERDVSLEMCAAKCTIYFRTRQFPCYAFEYTAGSRMCVFTNMTTLLIQDGYLGLHDNPSVDFYERSKGLHGSVKRITYNCLHFYICMCYVLQQFVFAFTLHLTHFKKNPLGVLLQITIYSYTHVCILFAF